MPAEVCRFCLARTTSRSNSSVRNRIDGNVFAEANAQPHHHRQRKLTVLRDKIETLDLTGCVVRERRAISLFSDSFTRCELFVDTSKNLHKIVLVPKDAAKMDLVDVRDEIDCVLCTRRS